MQAFDIHKSVVEDYKNYLNSFTQIKDPRIREKVDEAFAKGLFLPEALVQFNPSFKRGESLEDLTRQNLVHPDLKAIIGTYNLYFHQVEALRKGIKGESFVVTSGTGSGKSLIFLSTIFNKILQEGPSPGIRAIIVYPMNALINSQDEEIKKYEINYLKTFLPAGMTVNEEDKSLEAIIAELEKLTAKRFPITYKKYTGQEGQTERDEAKEEKSNIILTNYMMLELIMTRNNERWLRNSISDNLEFLVFDELHTYRGRQGSDVAMLIRRIHNLCKKKLICIGTSATMASKGSQDERKEAVARVAQQIFSHDFSKDQIVGETLETCTNFPGVIPKGFDLQEAIIQRIDPKQSAEQFVQNKLAIWLENAIALKRDDKGFLERNEPQSLRQIAEQLRNDTSEKLESCNLAILNLLQWTEQLNIEGLKGTAKKSYLPIKIHQFISQTGNVYVSLEPKSSRLITLETGRYVKVEGADKSIFPVLFSRYSGHDFICVRKVKGEFLPRNPDDVPQKITKEDLKGDRKEGISKRILTDDDFPDGYLIIPDEGEEIWNEEIENLLPENWLNTKKSGNKFDNYYEYRLPKKVYFDSDGQFSYTDMYPFQAWFIPARLLFDPTSGVIFDPKTNENTKLMRLGNEGRSTATTITSFSIIKALNEHGIDPKNQKLLSFTDNRQDASLQAGHFNDFLMLGRLRSAIYHAMKEAPDRLLTLDTIADAVFRKLNLKEAEYARNPSVDSSWPDPENEKAVKDYILIRILYDLKRGWRYNTPNLEQTALLEIDYYRFLEFCQQDRFFEGLMLFEKLDPSHRHKYLIQILNFFRTSYAFEYYKIQDKLAETEERLKNRLDENKLWSLDSDERIEAPTILMPKSVGETNYRVFTASIGPMSNLGKYIKRLILKHKLPGLSGDDLASYIESICSVLEKGHYLKSELIRGTKGDGKGFRLRIDQVIWKLGNGQEIIPDEVREASLKPIQLAPNDFFKKFYQQNFNSFQRTIIGREHTGQLSNNDRIEREDLFRSGEISALFCSPTMELGIDISQLNVVHLRNVPPNPANYAQRSGRAGRSGQAALIFTYCSNGSPHDRNYFKDSKKMIAGSVVPAKMDLSNEELILTHFNAYILMELGLKDLQTSVGDALLVSQLPELPIKPELKAHIEDHLNRFANQWSTNFRELARSIPELKGAYWYSDEWFFTHAKSFYVRFDNSFARWRLLYSAAARMVDLARSIMDDPTIKGDNPVKSEAKRDHNVGMRQKELLLNTAKRSFGGESEFYVYRHLASEGFLPGYNFTRLPVRAFLGYRYMDKGEYISRPRFIALKEFGPNNLIYHNGGKFRITRMNITQSDSLKQTIKISKRTGYAFLNQEAQAVNNDPITHEELKGQDFVEVINNLVELGESEARPQERISCEEEERMSTGFDIDQYFSFSKGIMGTKQVTIKEADQPLLQIIYDQSARLIQINKKWKASQNEEGFSMGKVTGKWKKAKELEKPNPDDPAMDVKLFTTGTADILYIQPIKELELDEVGVVSLCFALKRAIERLFQVEEGEVGVWIMGQGEHKNLLIYEAAEGSLGILSQLIENAQTLKEVFIEAYRVLHFDPHTKLDTKPEEPKASYDNLLSYYNQRFHEQLDRFSIKGALERLIDCRIDNQPGEKSPEEQYRYLLDNFDLNSSTEKPFVEFLFKNGYALPDMAQFNIPECYVSADFVYKTNIGYTLVFCDGSVHDNEKQKAEDNHKRQLCRDFGYDVIEWHYKEALTSLVDRRKDIIRKIR